MKTLRLALAALLLLAACDAPGPSGPLPPALLQGPYAPAPEDSPPCDSSCQARSPFMGGSGS